MIKVMIASDLVEQSFCTGNKVQPMEVLDGIPVQAKLTHAQVSRDGILELWFDDGEASFHEKAMTVRHPEFRWA